MHEILVDVEQWTKQRPKWLQDAAARLIQASKLTDQDIKELVDLCKVEVGLQQKSKEFNSFSLGSLSSKNETEYLRLVAISEVKEINALNPKKPLYFGSGQLSIVYGQNGSGKSSYVKVLKHVCGAREPGNLMGNVFLNTVQKQECTITFNDGLEDRQISWSPEHGTLQQLNAIQIYDTACANVYVNEENEVAFEPWILTFFTELTEVCQKVGQVLKEEIDELEIKEYNLPKEFQATSTGLWLHKVNYKTKSDEIEKNCRWSNNDDEVLNQLKQLLGEANPLEKAKKLSQTAGYAKDLMKQLQNLIEKYGEDNCKELLSVKNEMIVKKKAAEEDALKIFENSSLEGVGTESWKLLWQHARDFSKKHAYPESAFPYTGDEAKCVLCHQPLADDAKQRLDNFENYIKGALMKEAKEAEEHFKKLKTDLPEIPTQASIIPHLNSIGVTDESEQARFINFTSVLEKRMQSIDYAESMEEFIQLPDQSIINSLLEVATAYEQQASSLTDLAKQENREELSNKINELEARKWISQQQSLVRENVEKLKKRNKLEEAQKLTKTQLLSAKKSDLSNELITAEYTKRFNEELRALGGNRIKVELVKTRAQKGHIYHQIRLKNSNSPIKTADVLSEGEFRIVSLAGFLADVESNPHNTPFIFDDPISSLDQDFEEATVDRLIKLSETRQVIVFTHRISLLTLLTDKAEKKNISVDIVGLGSERWGAGEPQELPIYAKKTDKALNSLLYERLSKAKKLLNEVGREEYDPYVKGLCSDFRSLLERVIEYDLMDDVVHRFRRQVKTMGKIHNLAKIKLEDCRLIDDLMTKYSRYEHSQSIEAPVSLPEPDELKGDMETLRSWLEEFKSRS